MDIIRKHIGTTRGHPAQEPMDVEAYTLRPTPRFAVTVWTYGATLVETLVADRNETLANVVVRLPDLSEYENGAANQYVGATLGRFARCIANGRFVLDGVEHSLDRNCGAHHFHGGTIGFDRFVWRAEAGRDGDALTVRLRHESPDGDQGYPGMISAEVEYRANADGVLSISFNARTSKSTVVALTNHAYWNLAGGGVVDPMILRVGASRVVESDDDHIPTGQFREVEGTAEDFVRARPIADARIDACFMLDAPQHAAELYHPESGRLMRVSCDQPGLAVYSGDGLATPRAGICLQTGALPDAPNRPEFPSARLDPPDVYRHTVSYAFSVP